MNDERGHTIDNPNIDKKGAELDRQRFQMLRDIALELSVPTSFPANLEPIVHLSRALDGRDIRPEKAVALVAAEPAVRQRVSALANAPYYGRAGGPARDLQEAVERIGIPGVRAIALGLLMKELPLTHDVAAFHEQANRLWAHTLRSASAAYVVAKRLTKVNPDEALLGGVIHDIGGFYMIYRAAQYEELVLRPESAKYLVIRWHESIGHALAMALGLPDDIADALLDHDQPRPVPLPPQNLAAVIYLANLLAGGKFEWLDEPNGLVEREIEKLAALGQSLDEEIALHAASLEAAFA